MYRNARRTNEIIYQRVVNEFLDKEARLNRAGVFKKNINPSFDFELNLDHENV